MSKELLAGAGVVGLGTWLWRGGLLAGLLGTGAASMYYKGKAEAVMKEAESEALELERQKVALAQEQARLAEIKQQNAEIARERAELQAEYSTVDHDPEILLTIAALVIIGSVLLLVRPRIRQQNKNLFAST